MSGRLLAGALLASLAGCVTNAPATEPVVSDNGTAALRSLTKQASDLYVWGFPLVEAARIRLVSTRGEANGGASLTAPINRFAHGRVLGNPETRIGVGPNNDTLYSLIRMDLEQGPFVFTTPDFGSRYYTFSLNLADSSSPDSLGQRTHGSTLPPLFIHGPDYRGSIPDGMLAVESSTRYLALAGRILARGPEDYAEVHALQDALQLVRYEDYQAGRTDPPRIVPQRPLDDPSIDSPAELQFLEELGQVLRDWWFTAEDDAIREQARILGIGPNGFNPDALTQGQREAVARGLAQGRERVLARSLDLGVQANGWTINYSGARFGKDTLLRAAVAKDQIFVTVPEEAIYPVARTDASGRPLDGRNAYRIVIRADKKPPVDAFWSITLYDDHGFMVPNAIDRYSVGDRTDDLVTRDDGSIVIEISDTKPAAPDGNWLPAPAGPFYLMMRLYQPRQAVFDRSWLPPEIVLIE